MGGGGKEEDRDEGVDGKKFTGTKIAVNTRLSLDIQLLIAYTYIYIHPSIHVYLVPAVYDVTIAS